VTRTLIVNADDLGYDPAIDRGILKAARDGIVTGASVLVNLPGAAAAVAAARRQGLDLGLHLNLSRGPGLSATPSLTGPSGELSLDLARTASPEELLGESEAQLQRFVALTGRTPSHVDLHKHLHRHPRVYEALVRLVRFHRLPVRSVDAPMRAALRVDGISTPDAFVGQTGEQAFWTSERLLEAIDGAGPGVTELMCHPGFTPQAVQTSYSAQREVELFALTDPAVVARARMGDPLLEDWGSFKG